MGCATGKSNILFSIAPPIGPFDRPVQWVMQWVSTFFDLPISMHVDVPIDMHVDLPIEQRSLDSPIDMHIKRICTGVCISLLTSYCTA